MNDSVAYLEGYKKLNEAQKLAVDTVEGRSLWWRALVPARRTAHAAYCKHLRQTQATPTNILVLTFTESAARTVRTRLTDLWVTRSRATTPSMDFVTTY